MTRLLVALLFSLMPCSMALSRTITPEIGTGAHYPIWDNFEGERSSVYPTGGPGISFSLWMEVSPSIHVGLSTFYADYNLHITDRNSNSHIVIVRGDYAASFSDPKGCGIKSAVRYSDRSWSTLGFQPYLHAGLIYHRLRWTETYWPEGPGSPGAPNPTITTHPTLNQGAISGGLGLMRGQWIGFHMLLEAEYQLTVINRDRRADYMSVVLGFGF